MFRYLLVFVAVLCFFSSSASGQIPLRPDENKWEVSFFAGFSHLSGGDFVTPIDGGSTQTVGLDAKSRYILGGRITENLGERFGAELEYGVASHPLVFTNVRATAPRVEAEQKVHKLAYSVLFYASDRQKRVRPFGSVGAGASLYQVNSDTQTLQQGVDLKGRWKFAVSYGGGIKVQMGENWGLRGDFRDHITEVPDFGLPGTVTSILGIPRAAFRPEGKFHNWQVTMGVMYTFKVW